MSLYDELNQRDRQRDADVVKRCKAGESIASIGLRYAVSRQRAHQWVVRLRKEKRL